MQTDFLPQAPFLCLVRKNRFLKPCEKYYKRKPKRIFGRMGYKYAEKWKIMWKSRDNATPLQTEGSGYYLSSVKHCLDNLVAISAFLSLHDNGFIGLPCLTHQ